MKVFLNPGHHPGVDSGAVNNEYGVQEASIVRDIGVLVVRYLTYAGVEVEVLQSDNLVGESPMYPEVCASANESGADLFVSIHCNSAGSTMANGTETLVFELGGKAERAARAIQNQLITSIDTTDRGIKERPDLIVLRHTEMPAVLVEIAFISNDSDVDLLIHEQDTIARAIARGVTDYFCGEE